MPPDRTIIPLERSNSLLETLFLLMGLFVPMLLPLGLREFLHAHSRVWDALVILGFAWPVLGLAVFGLLWKRTIRPRRKRTLEIHGSRVILRQKERQILEMDLQRSHRLFFLAEDRHDYESGIYKQWVDLHVVQEDRRLDARLLLKSGDLQTEEKNHFLPRPADQTGELLIAADLKWTERILTGIEFAGGILTTEKKLPTGTLEAIQAYASQNTLLPQIAAVKAGQLKLPSLYQALR